MFSEKIVENYLLTVLLVVITLIGTDVVLKRNADREFCLNSTLQVIEIYKACVAEVGKN